MQQLAGILEYHGKASRDTGYKLSTDEDNMIVVSGTVGYSSTLMNGTSLKTMSGANLTITVENGTVFVNSAKVVTPDVLVANGVVHVIDK